MKKFLYLLIPFAFVFAQCADNQKNTKDGATTASVPPADTVAPADWFCSAIETYPVDANKTQRAVGGKNKFWPTGTVLKIGFIGGTASQIAAVKSYAAEWPTLANISFTYPTAGPYDVRIAFQSGGGAWSYVGTDCKLVTSQTQPTMNLGWIGPDVVKHEFGHTLGLFHEHQNPNGGICWNEANVIADLSGPPNNWSVAQIRFNVLDKLDANTVLTSPWDKTSIMHYNIPASWTCNNTAIPGGATISQGDKDFIKLRYPGVNPPTTSITLTGSQVNDIVSLLDARLVEMDTARARLQRSNATIKKMLGK